MFISTQKSNQLLEEKTHLCEDVIRFILDENGFTESTSSSWDDDEIVSYVLIFEDEIIYEMLRY